MIAGRVIVGDGRSGRVLRSGKRFSDSRVDWERVLGDVVGEAVIQIDAVVVMGSDIARSVSYSAVCYHDLLCDHVEDGIRSRSICIVFPPL